MSSKLAQDNREGFSARLTAALEAAGVAARPTALAHGFNARAGADGQITTHAARKWLLGEAIPTQARINILAVWLEVSPSWLRFGTIDGLLPAAKRRLTEDQALVAELQLLPLEAKELVRNLIKLLKVKR